jgi:putative transposase
MPSNRSKIPVGEYCHIYNRGVDKRNIFNSKEDVLRFKESLYIFNTKKPAGSLIRRKNELSVGVRPLQEPLVDIVAYSLLPNHFHLLLKQMVDGGISELMRRIQCGYTNYFNEENERSGVLFQGKYKYKHIPNNQYFKTIFCYVTFNSDIHNISKELSELTASSFQEYELSSSEIISEKEMDFIFEIFNDSNKIKSHGKEVVSIIRRQRTEKDFKKDRNFLE